MKRLINLGCGIFVLLVVAGCGVINNSGSSAVSTYYGKDGNVSKVVTQDGLNNSDVNSWANASVDFKKQDTKRLTGMVKSLYGQDSACPEKDKVCKAYSTIMKDFIVGFGYNFKPQEFSLAKPTSGYDVVNTGIGVAGDVINTIVFPLAMAKVAIDTNKNSTGVTNLQTAQGDIAVSDSLNRTETHATVLKGGSAAVNATATRDETTTTSDDTTTTDSSTSVPE